MEEEEEESDLIEHSIFVLIVLIVISGRESLRKKWNSEHHLHLSKLWLPSLSLLAASFLVVDLV